MFVFVLIVLSNHKQGTWPAEYIQAKFSERYKTLGKELYLLGARFVGLYIGLGAIIAS